MISFDLKPAPVRLEWPAGNEVHVWVSQRAGSRPSGRAFAAEVAARYFDAEPEVAIHATGKPFYNDRPGCFFSASHCGDTCLMVLAPLNVGADLEKTTRVRPFQEIAKRYLHPTEEARIASAGDSVASVFYRIWTRKEAILKMTGEGLSGRLGAFSVLDDNPVIDGRAVVVQTLEAGPWMLSIAAEKGVRVKDWFSADEVVGS